MHISIIIRIFQYTYIYSLISIFQLPYFTSYIIIMCFFYSLLLIYYIIIHLAGKAFFVPEDFFLSWRSRCEKKNDHKSEHEDFFLMKYLRKFCSQTLRLREEGDADQFVHTVGQPRGCHGDTQHHTQLQRLWGIVFVYEVKINTSTYCAFNRLSVTRDFYLYCIKLL